MMMKFNDKNYIAEKIRYYRKKHNLTQAKLAEMVDLSDQHLSRIESGTYFPSLKTFFTLIKVLKIDLREFGFNTEQTNNPVKDELISKIISADDIELTLYENLIGAVGNSLDKIKCYK